MIRQNDHAKSCKYRWPKPVHPIYHLFRGVVLLIGALMLSACQGNSQLSFTIDQQQITAFIKTLEQAVIAANVTELSLENEPDTSDPLYIESLRLYRNSSPTEIEIVRALSATVDFTRYEIVYHSEGLHVSGLMNVPNSHAPNLAASNVDNKPDSRLPVILLNHGHYAWEDYQPGLGTAREADYLAAQGYVTIASDYRGYRNSEGVPGNHFDPSWTHDVLNLLDGLADLDFVDVDRIGIWGHSTGGEIALQMVTCRPNIDAIVVFGSMGADMVDNIPLVVQERGDVGEKALEKYGTPDETPEAWAKLSPITYLADASGPIAIHHGRWDEEVPYQLSAKLWAIMQAAAIPGEYFFYPEQHHFFSGSDWTLAMERTVVFFDRYVKRMS